jgi:hypothetical protein
VQLDHLKCQTCQRSNCIDECLSAARQTLRSNFKYSNQLRGILHSFSLCRLKILMDLLRGVFEDEQRETIRDALVNTEIEDEPDLRDIVAGANVIEATTLLQNSLNGLSYQDAAVLAGLVFPQVDKVQQQHTPRGDSNYLYNKLLRKINKKLNIVTKEVIICRRIRLDIWRSSTCSPQEQTDFKESLINFYNCSDPSDPNILKCMVLDRFFSRNKVRASHIWKFSTGGEGLKDFNLLPLDLNSPRNGLLFCESIEECFDVKDVCFLIDRIHSENIFIKVLDPFLLDPLTSPIVADGCPLKFADIDGLPLQCPNGNLPFRRILDFHGKCSYEKAINKGWLPPDSTFTDFFNMSIGSSIPDLHATMDESSDEEDEERTEESSIA